MAGQDFSGFQRKRLNPFKGLVIDVPKWVDAHSYHSDKQRLHSMSLHRPGIVTGLEVVAWNPPDNSVVIHPGIALDTEGNTIVVPEVQRFQVNTAEKGTTHIIIRYSEIGQDITEIPGESKTQPLYIVEAFRIEEVRHEIGETDIELARINIGGRGTTIKDAADLLNPGHNEIDRNYRFVSGPRSEGYIVVGLVDIPGWERHQEGISNLVRFIRRNTNFRATSRGPFSLTEEIKDCDLLYISGSDKFEFTEEQESILKGFVGRGGVILGEACSEGGEEEKERGKAFRQAFGSLSQKLGANMRSVEWGHPVLKSYHVFSDVPVGLDGPALLAEDQGIIYSDGDYGCLWRGGRADRSVPRQTIRDALELGVNIALYAHQRTSYHTLKVFGK